MTRTTHRARWRSASVAALSAVLALGLVGCSSNGAAAPVTSGGTPVDGGTLYWSVETKLTTVNPQRNGQDKATPILRNAFSSYLYRNASGDYEPWLASGYKVSSDGLTVTLSLKSGITFSDGDAFDADAVVKNFDKIESKGYLSSIPGGLKYVTKYEKVDASTVAFTLSKPDTLFLLYLSGTSSAPLSPKSLAKEQSVLESGGPQLAGIGPFTISAFTPNTELDLTKRADYAWAPASIAKGQTAAHLDKVIYRTLPEGSTRTGALQQGQVQISSDIQPLDVSLFDGVSGFAYKRTYVSGLPYSLYLNVSKAPFNDPAVREAFIKGADLKAIITSIYKGGFDQATAPVSAVGPWAAKDVLASYATNVDAANKLLDAAGWTQRNSDGIRTKDGQTLTVRAVSGAPYVRESRDQLNIALAAALKQNVGIDYKFEIVDSGTEDTRSKANDYEVFDNSYGGADPAVGLDLLYSSDPSRGFIARGHYNDATIDSLLDKGRFTTDAAARVATYTTLQQYIVSKYYALPLYQTQDNLAATSKVQGVTIDAATGQPFGAYTIWLAQ